MSEEVPSRPSGGSRRSSALSEPDEQSAAADRTAKKRVQNRVAQRTYRHRVKKRLEDLQQQVDEHERNMAFNIQNMQNINGNTNGGSMPWLISEPGQGHESIGGQQFTQQGHQFDTGYLNCSTVFPGDTTNMDYSSMTNNVLEEHQHQLSNPNYHFEIARQLAVAAGQSHNGGDSPFNLGPMQQDQSLSYQLQNQHDMNNGGDAMDTSTSNEQWPFPGDFSGYISGSKGQESEQQDPANWKHSPGTNASSSTNSRSPASNSSKRTTSSRSTPQLPSMQGIEDDSNSTLKLPGRDASIEERMEYVLSCAKQADFDGLDSLITTYYTENFSQASSVSAEQRISRRRQLPNLVAELRKQSGNWSQWERNGFEDEVLRTAEEICAAESSRFIAGDDIAMPAGGSSFEGSNPSVTPKTFQDEMPHLWALLTSLMSSNMSIMNGDRSNIVFASMMLSCFWGRVPNSKLMSWLNICLGDTPKTEK